MLLAVLCTIIWFDLVIKGKKKKFLLLKAALKFDVVDLRDFLFVFNARICLYTGEVC